jgi:hypothetical protein
MQDGWQEPRDVLFVNGRAFERPTDCGAVPLGKLDKCAVCRGADGRTEVRVNGKTLGTPTSCGELRLAPGETCEVRPVRDPKMVTKVFVDGKERPAPTSCDDLRVPKGQTCNEVLSSVEAEWYGGRAGQLLGLGMLVVLALLCFFLARMGAKWALAATPAEEKPKEEKT